MKIDYPITRQTSPHRKRKSFLLRRALRHLRKCQGAVLAARATTVSRLFGKPDRRYQYDTEADLHLFIENDRTHWFLSAPRLWTVFDGLAARGTELSEQYLLDGVPIEAGDWIVDIGANTGDLSLCFEEKEDRGGIPINMISFEPSPREFAALERNLASKPAILSHECHRLALWKDDAGELSFFVKSDGADSSVLPISGASHEIKVPTARLDEVIPQRSYKLLKLEAEGAEPEILAGAEGVIGCFQFITADVGFERGVTAASTLPDIVNFLTARGFEVVGYNGGRHVVLFRNTQVPKTEDGLPEKPPFAPERGAV